MDEQAKDSYSTQCLIQPKEEFKDNIEIYIENLNDCYDNNDCITPKEELSNTSLQLDAEDLNNQKYKMPKKTEPSGNLFMPVIKIEPSEDIAQLQQQQELSGYTGTTPTEYEFKGITTVEIKVEPMEPETSVPADCKKKLGTPLPKKCLQMHNDTAATYSHSCNVCEYKCKYKSLLASHLRTHTGEKPFSCNLCQKDFTQKSHLTCHMKTHTGEKHYSCDLCHKKFTNKSNLTEHTRTHTGEKPYSCNICQVKYAQKNHLTAHIKTHTGERPYSCDICFIKFTHKHHLTNHSRIHTGEKPYSCGLCKVKFTRKYLLTTHMKTHRSVKTCKNTC